MVRSPPIWRHHPRFSVCLAVLSTLFHDLYPQPVCPEDVETLPVALRRQSHHGESSYHTDRLSLSKSVVHCSCNTLYHTLGLFVKECVRTWTASYATVGPVNDMRRVRWRVEGIHDYIRSDVAKRPDRGSSPESILSK